MPVTEHLSDLAQHKATMAILLSAGLVDKVEADLLAGGLDPQTPAAIVVRATWPDERVYRCTVDTLVSVATDNHVERTAIILVGDALAATKGTSLLYDATFSHGYRKGHEGEGGAHSC